jgi:hypothetical protein
MNRKFFISCAVISVVVLNSPMQGHAFCNKLLASVDVGPQMLSNEEQCLLYLSCGYSNLLSKKYKNAFDDYKKALNELSDSENPGAGFLISFGMVVSCDNLDLVNESQEHMLRIGRLINNAFDGEQSEIGKSDLQDNQEMINRLTSIASMAASPETQDILISFISEIYPTSLTAYSRTSWSVVTPSVLVGETNAMARPAKSFWKQLECLGTRIARAWNKIFKIYKEVREVEDDIRGRLSHEAPNVV